MNILLLQKKDIKNLYCESNIILFRNTRLSVCGHLKNKMLIVEVPIKYAIIFKIEKGVVYL